MEKTLLKKSFSKWVTALESYNIYAPLKNDDVWNIEKIKKGDNINLDYPNTIISTKKILFPQKETLLEFGAKNENKLEIKESQPEESQNLILGIRPCDAKAITLMDLVFGGDFQDTNYWKRRNKTLFIGLSCNIPPSSNCFCISVDGSPHATEGLDILMTDLKDKYYLQSVTKNGEKLLKSAGKLLSDPTANDKKDLTNTHANAVGKLKRQIKDAHKIHPKLKDMFDSSFWENESLGCIRCGICTYLCPTCHCFDINDELISVSPLKGRRVKTWDNCQFPDFTMHSSGHNPRPNKSSRLRQRILHKFLYFVERYQKFQCTGCGRCVTKCPVGIDIIEVLNKVPNHES